MRYHYFSPKLNAIENRFWAVLIENVEVETRDEAITKSYEKGIYIFETKDQRNLFTKAMNATSIEPIAYQFNRAPRT